MSIYFAFSDENGQYRVNRNEKFIEAHPYFLRSTFIINGNEWKYLKDEFFKLKEEYKLPTSKEIKWSYLWSLKNYQKDKKVIPESKDFYFLKDIDYDILVEFVEKILTILSSLNYVKIIFTVSDNSICPSINEIYFYRMHLQEHMQRLEMELRNSDENLAVLFLDPISEKINELLRKAYNSLYLNGDFIKKYIHIKDSINFENSHHSIGIQIADYIAGVFSGFLKGYSRSVQIFNNTIRPLIRKDRNNDPFGYGIREVPKNDKFREIIRAKYNSL